MKHLIYTFTLAMLVMTSCKENIDFDYDTAATHCVIEGYVTNNGMEVTVGNSLQMEDTEQSAPITDATVRITGDDGSEYTLQHQGNGVYALQPQVPGVPGVSYTVNVVAEGQEYSSYSTMQKSTNINAMWFSWEDIVGVKTLTLRFKYNDIPDEPNYYCYRIYRNGKSYRWGLMRDLGFENTEIEKYVTCISEKAMQDNDDDYYERMLTEGDKITLQLLVIDRRTYDYLYSLNVGNRNHANPIDNFSNGAFGYFTACGITQSEITLTLPAEEPK